MTKEQYERWKDFALRMVDVTVGPRKRSPSRKDVRENILFFFECRMDDGEDGGEWERVQDWDTTDEGEDGYRAWSVSSHLSDLAEHFIPNYWAICDSESQYNRAEARWVDPVHTCVRAGLDVAVAPSAGVLGFTAGQVRQMFPEGVPGWVKDFFQPGDMVALHPTSVNGIFVPEVTGFDERTFDQLPDAEPVWL